MQKHIAYCVEEVSVNSEDIERENREKKAKRYNRVALICIFILIIDVLTVPFMDELYIKLIAVSIPLFLGLFCVNKAHFLRDESSIRL